MIKTFLIFSALICLSFLATNAFAMDLTYGMRRQADSQFRIAEKAYRKAIREYGDSMEGLPEKERLKACRKMSSALHDNRTQFNMEDTFGQMKYKEQVEKLEGYSTAFGCPD